MEAVTVLELIKMYLLLDISFILTSYFTLHIPAWRIAKLWASENLREVRHPSKGYIISHTITYTLVAFIAFPFLLAMLLVGNKQAVISYSGTIIKDIGSNEKE